MEPIISPWIVYGIGVITKLSIVAFITMVISIMGMFMCILNEQEKRIFKILAIIFVVATALLVILPTKDTMLTMLALQYVTPDNVQAVQGNVADFVNQIMQAVKNAK